jgi:hypothetical protein
MTHKDEALKLALEALEDSCTPRLSKKHYAAYDKAITTIKQALAAQPAVQEPVAWLIPGSITTDPELAKANGDKAVALGKISTQQWNPEDHYKDGWRDALESVKRATPLAAQPAPVQGLPFGVGGGLVAIKTLLGRDPCVHANTAIEMIDAILKEHPAAQPAVPDAITDNSESPEYRTGWNDCRQAMMEMMK